MNLNDLKGKIELIISNLKDKGEFPKENDLIDYKLELKLPKSKQPFEVFLLNFTKDIISFSNSDGGIILIGIKEDKVAGKYTDVGLGNDNLEVLDKIDLNDITQQFEKITKIGVSLDLQMFQISTRKYYYLLIQKNNQTIIPQGDYPQYKLLKGGIYYRTSGKNEHANKSTSDFNRFLQIKANERSKEFMEIWSKLLPEMVDINPREVLILNPNHNKVYGFNSKDNILAGSDIEVDKTQNGVFNIILNAISAGEIGKITTNEGKPIYKIVGEIQNNRERIMLTNLWKEVDKHSKFKFSSEQLKEVMMHLEWVTDSKFKALNPSEGIINSKFARFIWIETTDNISLRTKVFFSSDAIPALLKVVDDKTLHSKVFGKNLVAKPIDTTLSKAN